jgi:hypothetical protein
LGEAGNDASIKSNVMQKQSFKSNDDLIQGIEIILSNYRCSFSDEEQVLLKDCVNRLQDSNLKPDLQGRVTESVKVVEILIRIFSIYEHIKDLF